MKEHNICKMQGKGYSQQQTKEVVISQLQFNLKFAFTFSSKKLKLFRYCKVEAKG
jgi:hypothetical protein